MSTPLSALVIAGLTGAGKSLALQHLQQMGWAGVDAISPELVPICLRSGHHPRQAIVLDLSLPSLLKGFDSLRAWLAEHQVPLLFLEAADPVLVARISANRLRHPYLEPIHPPASLLAAIQSERHSLDPVRQASTYVLDTSSLNAPQLMQHLEAIIQGSQAMLTVTLLSFGFKYGVPLDANLMFDVRFLPNPYFVPELRLYTGQDPVIQEFLFADPLTQRTYQHIEGLVSQFLPSYQAERRSQVTVAIGCTGGQHRSVTLVERLEQDLRNRLRSADHSLLIQVQHRHLTASQRELQARFADPVVPHRSL